MTAPEENRGLSGALDRVFAPLDALGRAFSGLGQWIRAFARDVVLLKVVFTLVLLVTAIYDVASRVLSIADWVLDRIETAIIFVATLGMTGLVFLDLLERETGLFDLPLDGVVRIALLLMLWVAFLGASLATRDGRHLVIDAADRALSPGSSRWLYRLSMAIAAVFSWQLYGASRKVIAKHFETEALAKLTLPESLASWMNGWAAWFLETRLSADDFEYYAEEGGFAADLVSSGMKLWVAELVLPVAFLLMALRFAGRFFAGPPEADPDLPPAYRRKRATGQGAKTADVLLAGLFPGLLLGMLAGTWLGQGWLVVCCTVMMLLVGAPLFVVIGVAASLSVMLLEGQDLTYVVSDIYKASDKEVLLAIPFFVMAGAIMTEGSIARRLIDMARAAIGWFPGGLAITGVLSCMVFAAISGSSPVTVIAIGSILVPALIEAGYNERFSLGLLTSAGSLGILIPPSIPMIIYAVVVFTDPTLRSQATGSAPTVQDLFVAGILPGLLIGGILMGWSVFRERDKVLPMQETVAELPGAMARGVWAAGLPVLIIGGIYSGLFTATEAAAVSVVYALAVEYLIHPVVKKATGSDEPLFDLPAKELPRVFRDSAVIMGALLLIVVLAIALNQFLVFQKIPELAAEWVKSRVDTQFEFLVLVNLFLLVLGCLMDIMSAILIVAPLLAPIAVSQYQIDPIHFGIIFIVNLEIGYLTPPLGLNLFVASTVFERPILTIIRSVVPFTLLLLLALVLISWIPGLSLWLL